MTFSVAIVGATGYVGRRVVGALTRSGCVEQLQLFSRNAPSASTFDGISPDRYNWQRVDAMDMLDQPQKWAELLQGECELWRGNRGELWTL